MDHNFAAIPSADIQRSTFDRSHGYKTAFDSGYLVPFFVDEVLPGDTFKLDVSLFGRLSTPVVPFMDNLHLETFFFFVPTRLVWDNWQKFNGEQRNPSDSTDFLIPTLADNTQFDVQSIGDYFGLPTGVKLSKINALPFRAYNLIYNEWFRDENLQESLEVPYGDGPDRSDIYNLVRRGKRHDYFTSALPWPQKGPGVELPLGDVAQVTGTSSFTLPAMHIPVTTVNVPGGQFQAYRASDGGSGSPDTSVYGLRGVGRDAASAVIASRPAQTVTGNITGTANLDAATAITINSLRQAFQLQRLYERDARGGTRYTEILRSHFGVISPDARLQRPEYLGGSSTRININPVQQTSATDSTTPQGNLAAFGVLGSSDHVCNKSFVEHGYIIGFCNVRADLTYQQGINRMWSRRTRFDFYWPSLAHLGEQTILNKEIYAQGTEADEEVFGYQERYAEYRYKPSMITGKLRSTDPQPLDVWHLSQKFNALPKLNSEFIEERPPLERVLAVQNEPQIILDCYFRLKSTRPMPVFGVPGLIDHF